LLGRGRLRRTGGEAGQNGDSDRSSGTRTITKNERRNIVTRGWRRIVRDEDDYKEQEDEAEQNGDSGAMGEDII